MAIKHWFITSITSVNHQKLNADVAAAGYVIESSTNDLKNNRVGLDLELSTLTEPQRTQLQSIIDTHDSTDPIAVQINDAQISLQPLIANLSTLSAEDAAYAMMGRAMAVKDGASQVTISGIIDRSTASSYIQGKTEWINLPATAKAWLADQLDMEAMLFQTIIVTLKR